MASAHEQYYPTYTFPKEHRDIVLIEFEEAQKIANGQTKVYGQLTNIIIAASTILISLITSGNLDKYFLAENEEMLGIVIIVFGALILRYFVDLQKQITINARKVVTLRTMLGLNYGKIRLTLPENRVEGATNPFKIKYFTGWIKFQTMPFWIITIAVNAIFYILIHTKDRVHISVVQNFSHYIPNAVIHLSILVLYVIVFRGFLLDEHESRKILITKFLAKCIDFRLVVNFENIFYRAKLEVIEMERLCINYENLKLILIAIEDKDFYSNKGVNYKSLVRGLLSSFPLFRKKYNILRSGGSTITMQLVRSLLFKSLDKKFRRKLFEVLFANQFSEIFSKKEILELYIVSVRYAKNVYGIARAYRHFFGVSAKGVILSPEISFILVERLSNVTNRYNEDRVNYLLAKVHDLVDKDEVLHLYQTLLSEGKIDDPKTKFN